MSEINRRDFHNHSMAENAQWAAEMFDANQSDFSTVGEAIRDVLFRGRSHELVYFDDLPDMLEAAFEAGQATSHPVEQQKTYKESPGLTAYGVFKPEAVEEELTEN